MQPRGLVAIEAESPQQVNERQRAFRLGQASAGDERIRTGIAVAAIMQAGLRPLAASVPERGRIANGTETIAPQVRDRLQLLPEGAMSVGPDQASQVA